MIVPGVRTSLVTAGFAGAGVSDGATTGVGSDPVSDARAALAGLAAGSFRSVAGTGGRGRSAATKTSTSRLVLWRAAASTSR